MPYVQRDARGRITSIHRHAVPGAEHLPSGHPELKQVLGALAAAAPAPVPPPPAERSFASLDADLIRVLEDLVDVLVARNILRITDLPAEAQHKLFARKHFRDRFQHNALQLYGDAATFDGEALIPTVGMDAPEPGPGPRTRL
jgi:hypothetical protein